MVHSPSLASKNRSDSFRQVSNNSSTAAVSQCDDDMDYMNNALKLPTFPRAVTSNRPCFAMLTNDNPSKIKERQNRGKRRQISDLNPGKVICLRPFDDDRVGKTFALRTNKDRATLINRENDTSKQNSFLDTGSKHAGSEDHQNLVGSSLAFSSSSLSLSGSDITEEEDNGDDDYGCGFSCSCIESTCHSQDYPKDLNTNLRMQKSDLFCEHNDDKYGRRDGTRCTRLSSNSKKRGRSDAIAENHDRQWQGRQPLRVRNSSPFANYGESDLQSYQFGKRKGNNQLHLSSHPTAPTSLPQQYDVSSNSASNSFEEFDSTQRRSHIHYSIPNQRSGSRNTKNNSSSRFHRSRKMESHMTERLLKSELGRTEARKIILDLLESKRKLKIEIINLRARVHILEFDRKLTAREESKNHQEKQQFHRAFDRDQRDIQIAGHHPFRAREDDKYSRKHRFSNSRQPIVFSGCDSIKSCDGEEAPRIRLTEDLINDAKEISPSFFSQQPSPDLANENIKPRCNRDTSLLNDVFDQNITFCSVPENSEQSNNTLHQSELSESAITAIDDMKSKEPVPGKNLENMKSRLLKNHKNESLNSNKSNYSFNDQKKKNIDIIGYQPSIQSPSIYKEKDYIGFVAMSPIRKESSFGNRRNSDSFDFAAIPTPSLRRASFETKPMVDNIIEEPNLQQNISTDTKEDTCSGGNTISTKSPDGPEISVEKEFQEKSGFKGKVQFNKEADGNDKQGQRVARSGSANRNISSEASAINGNNAKNNTDTSETADTSQNPGLQNTSCGRSSCASPRTDEGFQSPTSNYSDIGQEPRSSGISAENPSIENEIDGTRKSVSSPKHKEAKDGNTFLVGHHSDQILQEDNFNILVVDPPRTIQEVSHNTEENVCSQMNEEIGEGNENIEKCLDQVPRNDGHNSEATSPPSSLYVANTTEQDASPYRQEKINEENRNLHGNEKDQEMVPVLKHKEVEGGNIDFAGHHSDQMPQKDKFNIPFVDLLSKTQKLTDVSAENVLLQMNREGEGESADAGNVSDQVALDDGFNTEAINPLNALKVPRTTEEDALSHRHEEIDKDHEYDLDHGPPLPPLEILFPTKNEDEKGDSHEWVTTDRRRKESSRRHRNSPFSLEDDATNETIDHNESYARLTNQTVLLLSPSDEEEVKSFSFIDNKDSAKHGKDKKHCNFVDNSFQMTGDDGSSPNGLLNSDLQTDKHKENVECMREDDVKIQSTAEVQYDEQIPFACSSYVATQQCNDMKSQSRLNKKRRHTLQVPRLKKNSNTRKRRQSL